MAVAVSVDAPSAEAPAEVRPADGGRGPATAPRRPPRPPTTDRGEGGTSDTVRMYLKEIGRVSLLTAEDERDLAMRIEAGVQAEERRAANGGVRPRSTGASWPAPSATATRPGPS